jgi:hypothetical protein
MRPSVLPPNMIFLAPMVDFATAALRSDAELGLAPWLNDYLAAEVLGSGRPAVVLDEDISIASLWSK